jgi:hypothetical protein
MAFLTTSGAASATRSGVTAGSRTEERMPGVCTFWAHPSEQLEFLAKLQGMGTLFAFPDEMAQDA